MSIRMALAALVVGSACFAAPVAHAEDCRFTQGYWQNHAQNVSGISTTWSSMSQRPFYQSGMTYAQVLLVAPRGNAYWILAHQLVAAEANRAIGADPSGVPAQAISVAQQLMQTYTPAQINALPKSDQVRQDMTYIASILDKWNNGLIGTGVCAGNGGGSNN